MTQHPCSKSANEHISRTDSTQAEPLTIGAGFEALSFKHTQFHGLMDPLVMVDHFTMTKPTFGPHPHAGMSAVSVLFEDSQGQFHNRDSLGGDFDLLPGDLYWLKAGRGAVHDESPRTGARTHALQIFVNLPKRMKHDAPDSLHVPATDMPVVQGERFRVRIVLGESNGVVGASSPALPLTILDVQLKSGGSYVHRMPPNQAAWQHAGRGDAELRVNGETLRLPEGEAVALRSKSAGVALKMNSATGAHVVLLQGAPIGQPFVQQGPFVMSTDDELRAVTADYAAGRLGSLD